MSIAQNFQGLPMNELIAAPLIAASDAQQKLADTTLNFISKMFDENNKAKTIEFNHTTLNGGEVKIQAPLISIVNVPSLSVKTVDVEFSMEVKDQEVNKTSLATDTKVESSYKAWFSPFSVNMTCNVSTRSSNERTSDKSAKYDVKLHAEDAGPPEGLSRLLDIFESCIPKAADLDRIAAEQKGSAEGGSEGGGAGGEEEKSQ